MDSSPQNVIVEKTNEKTSGKMSLFLPFQILGIIIILGAITFLLNYLNLFRLDFYFPSLSTLPRIQPKTLQYNPYQKPPTFTYDQAIPEKSLPDFLRRALKPEFLPQSFTIIHKLNSSNQQTDTDYTYGTTWTKNNVQYNGFYHFNINTNNHMDSQVIIAPSGNSSGKDAKTLISQYFNADGSKANCKVINASSKTQACEVFYPDFTGIKHGFAAIVHIPDKGTFRDFVFACEISTESLHSTWRSCLQEFAATGIQ